MALAPIAVPAVHGGAAGKSPSTDESAGGLRHPAWWVAAKRLAELGDRGEQILLEAVVGDAEDRRLGVLVDGDDHLGILHAGEMLDRAADADGDVELGRDDLAGLA